MKPHDLAISNDGKRKPVHISGRGCPHCRKRVALLSSEDTCPETYRCLFCKARWIFALDVRMDIEDWLAMSETEQAEFLNGEGLLGIDLLLE
jgi:hypothetical protein